MDQAMTTTVCLVPAPTIGDPRGGGHFREYLNRALALRAIGCRVIWLQGVVAHWWGGTFEAGESRRRLVSDGD